MVQYIADNVRSNFRAPVQLISPGSEDLTEEEFKLPKKSVLLSQKTRLQSLNFITLDLKTSKLFRLTDAFVANAEGRKLQLEYVVLLADCTGACNIIHVGSSKCKRIARSVVASEVQALVLSLDHSLLVENLLVELLARTLELEAIISSR